MTNGMRDLAGTLWWFRPKVKTIIVTPVEPAPAESISEDTGPEPVQDCAALPIEVSADSQTRTQETVRAVPVVVLSPSLPEPVSKRIVSDQGALEILIFRRSSQSHGWQATVQSQVETSPLRLEAHPFNYLGRSSKG